MKAFFSLDFLYSCTAVEKFLTDSASRGPFATAADNINVTDNIVMFSFIFLLIVSNVYNLLIFCARMTKNEAIYLVLPHRSTHNIDSTV